MTKYFLTSSDKKQIFADVTGFLAAPLNKFVADFPQFQVTKQTEIPLDYEYAPNYGNLGLGVPYVPTRSMSETHNWCCVCEEYTLKARCLNCGEKTYSPAAMKAVQ